MLPAQRRHHRCGAVPRALGPAPEDGV